MSSLGSSSIRGGSDESSIIIRAFTATASLVATPEGSSEESSEADFEASYEPNLLEQPNPDRTIIFPEFFTLDSPARRYLGTEETPFSDIVPRSHYPGLLHEGNPYYKFGFVAVSSIQLGWEMGRIYYCLFTRLTSGQRPVDRFLEFHEAYVNGKIVSMLRRHGLTAEFEALGPPHILQRFLANTPDKPRPSVWGLKQFVLRTADNLCPALIAKAYGFDKCRDYSTVWYGLKDIYIHLLAEADPYSIHDHCRANKLWSLIKIFFPDCAEVYESIVTRVET